MAQRDLGALRDWATGVTTRLVAYEAYAWGGPLDLTVLDARCLYTRTAVVTTTIAAGSLPAFATYLHSLGDSYSHLNCIQAMDALGYPWATHSQISTNIPACYYPVNNPSNDDAHGREFGTSSMTDSLRTDAALRNIYQELAVRSLSREGAYAPIGLETIISGSQTLSDTIAAFVYTWDFDQPQARRAYADELATKILALTRTSIKRVYLPIALK